MTDLICISLGHIRKQADGALNIEIKGSVIRWYYRDDVKSKETRKR